MKTLFGGIKMTWKKVIIFALIAGAFTALMAICVPEGNSFHEIAVHLEAWILFAMIIITNCEKPTEAALKTFVFFLISQPLVYLIQVPFAGMGFGIFMYYKYWFIITLLTLPGGFIAWYIKKNNILSALILSIALVMLIAQGVTYLKDTTVYFPRHIVSTVFCFGVALLFIFGILHSRKTRLIAGIICLAAVLFFGYRTFSQPSFYTNRIIDLDKSKYPIDDTWTVRVENEKISEAKIHDWGNNDWDLEVFFHEAGPNTVILTDGSGKEYRLIVSFDKSGEATVQE